MILLFRFSSIVTFICLFFGYPFASNAALDVIFANFYTTNRSCLGDGTGNFTCRDVSPETLSTHGVALGDVNDDTFLDAVFTPFELDGGLPQVCLGDGAGSFICLDISGVSSGGRDVALDDVNGDTFLDAVFANTGGNNVCLGNGTGSFACSSIVNSGSTTQGVDLGDVNDDTFLDAVFATIHDVNKICLGNGAGQFTCNDVSPDIDFSPGVAVGDIDDDNNLDAVFAVSGTNRVCLGNGGGQFTCSNVSPDVDNSNGVALGDINGDNNLDAVFAVSEGTNRVCLGNGAGQFICSNVSPDVDASIRVALGDINRDTFLDAVFANTNLVSEGAFNRVCLGDGAGQFTCSNVSSDFNDSFGVAIGEFNTAVLNRESVRAAGINALEDDIDNLLQGFCNTPPEAKRLNSDFYERVCD